MICITLGVTRLRNFIMAILSLSRKIFNRNFLVVITEPPEELKSQNYSTGLLPRLLLRFSMYSFLEVWNIAFESFTGFCSISNPSALQFLLESLELAKTLSSIRSFHMGKCVNKVNYEFCFLNIFQAFQTFWCKMGSLTEQAQCPWRSMSVNPRAEAPFCICKDSTERILEYNSSEMFWHKWKGHLFGNVILSNYTFQSWLNGSLEDTTNKLTTLLLNMQCQKNHTRKKDLLQPPTSVYHNLKEGELY